MPSMIQRNKSVLLQVNFPASQAGKASDVYYTVYNEDESVYLSRRNTNVLEFGAGAYGVLLSFSSEVNYSIHWDIDSTPYVANEEITVHDFQRLVIYSGYGL